jgi:predicted ATPase
MPTNRLIGRDRELAELEARARTNRLVTVVGPGGVGKTALARAVADRLGAQYALGVRQVDLTRINDEHIVPGAIATQLGFDSFDALLSSPNDRPILLVVATASSRCSQLSRLAGEVRGAGHEIQFAGPPINEALTALWRKA